ncbi:MAG: DUF2079 domain-containing protein [Archangium sp.]|nr:DUF2079 domain-containing protein [Archangium sp.]
MAHVRAAALKRALPFLGLLPVALYLMGVYPVYVARVTVGVVGLITLATWRSPPEFTPWLERAARVLLVLVPFAVAFHQVTRVVAGMMGVDFAIFTQASHAIARTGVPTTTLLFDEPVNFLSHHFAPVLYLPGLVTWLGVPAPYALIACYALSFGLALWALRRFCIGAGLPAATATLWTLVVALSPSIRPEILWGVHDEIFALPLAGWSLVLLQERRWWPSLALAASTVVAKESFFMFPFVWCVLAWTLQRSPDPLIPSGVEGRGRNGPLDSARGERIVIAGTVALVWLAAGGVYVLGHPWWSGREFDHLNRFALSALGTGTEDRVLFVAALLGPLLAFPLRSRSALLWCLPALPFIALCLLSSDPEMFRPTGYHATIPAYLLGFAGAVGLKSTGGKWLSSQMVVMTLLAAQLSWEVTALRLPLRLALAAQWYPAPELALLPKDQVVAADPAAVLSLLDHPGVKRLWRVPLSQQHPGVLVFKPDGWETPGADVAAGYAPCLPSGRWTVLCDAP